MDMILDMFRILMGPDYLLKNMTNTVGVFKSTKQQQQGSKTGPFIVCWEFTRCDNHDNPLRGRFELIPKYQGVRQQSRYMTNYDGWE